MTQEELLQRARELTRELDEVLGLINYDAHGSATVQDFVDGAKSSNSATRTQLRAAGRVVYERGAL